jgi:hypothetical protein
MKISITAMRSGSIRRGLSILMTSAPMSAKSFVAKGPAHTIVRSTTRTPSSGRP